MIIHNRGTSKDRILCAYLEQADIDFESSQEGQVAVVTTEVFWFDGGPISPAPPEPPEIEDWDMLWDILPDGRVLFGFTTDNSDVPGAHWVVRRVLFVPRGAA